MKSPKFYLILALTLISLTANSQISLDSIWKHQIIERYKQLDNYTIQIITHSTIRDRYRSWTPDKDTIYNQQDTTIAYVEWKNQKLNFAGVRSKDMISYTTNDTNTTINFYISNFIAINSIKDNWGGHFDYVGITDKSHLLHQ